MNFAGQFIRIQACKHFLSKSLLNFMSHSPYTFLYSSMLYSLLEFEWKISELGAFKTDIEENPFKRREIRDVLSIAVRNTYRDAEDSDEDSD